LTEKTSYEPGTPSWVDLGSPDPDASVSFYSDLFGWEVHKAEDPAAGGYRMAYLRDKAVAGLAPLMQEGQPPAWTTYVTVTDADETAEKVKSAGGQVFMGPIDVLDVGRMAVFADPTGAVFAVWQPGTHPGAGLVNEPGALAWNEVNTRDPDAAKSFYGDVFGWEAVERDMGEAGTYVTWRLSGAAEEDESIGGMLDMRGRVPEEVPAHWLAYFAVESLDATIEKAKAGGGGVVLEPLELPMGRLAIVKDPQDAMFGVWESTA